MLAWLRRLIGRSAASASAINPASFPEAVGPVPQPSVGQPLMDGDVSSPVAPLASGGRNRTASEPIIDSKPLAAVTRTRPPTLRIVVGADQGGGRTALSRRPDKDEARWIPAGRPVTVHGFEILDGMVYVGRFLNASPNVGHTSGTPAPCLIDPSLKVASGEPRMDVDMDFWPSYSQSTKEKRLTYLHWLASGKKDTGYPIGCAFLYYYGLERRLLVDDPSSEEEAVLIAEVRRLRELHRSHHSFRGYSSGLLDIMEARRLLGIPGALDAWVPEPAAVERDISLALRIKLGLMALDGRRLDFEHAMAAMLGIGPTYGGVRLTGGAASRVRVELVELVRHRFKARFPTGFKLRDRKDSDLRPYYHPASQHLLIQIKLEGVGRLPDPATLTWTKLTELCETASSDLAPYARLVGKGRDRASSVRAALALPPELGESEGVRLFKAWLDALPHPIAEVPVAELARRCFGEGQDTIGLSQMREMSAMLGRVGYEMEPDRDRGGGKPGAIVALFPAVGVADASTTSSQAFQTASLILSAIGPAASKEDGMGFASALAAHLGLDPHETMRLTARQRVLPDKLLPPVRLKTIMNAVVPERRPTLGALAATVAAISGETDHGMIVALERLWTALGLERRDLYTALHQGAASAMAPATEPVVVEETKARGRGHRIPPRPSKSVPPSGIVIDMARVGAILQDTRQVDAMLAHVYEEETAEAPPLAATASMAGREARFPGLGAEHADLLEALIARPEWSRAEFEAQAETLGLMPDGALEAINEWGYDTFDEELIENGDPLTVNVALLAGASGGTS